MKNTFKTTFTLLMSAILFSSCVNENEEDLFPPVEEENTTVSLVDDVQPIITQNCAVTGCHVAGSVSPNLSTKEGTLSKSDRVNARAVVAKSMPPSGELPQANRDVIATWILEGGLDN